MDDTPQSVNRLTDPRALRALAHPIRLSLLGLLRTEGPLTATRAGELLGESSASTSFHLRQLAKYGLAEEAGGGRGRERPWRATAMFTDVPSVADSAELAAASDMFRSVIAERYYEDMVRWLETRSSEPAEWQQADIFSDRMLYLTAAELAALGEEIEALVSQFDERLTRPKLRPPGAQLVTYLHAGFPRARPGDRARPGGAAGPAEEGPGR